MQAISTATNVLSQAIEGLLDLVKDLRTKLQARAMRRRTINELSSLNDHELRDLGISRSDITSIANGTFHDGRVNRRGKIKPTIEQENDNLRGWV